MITLAVALAGKGDKGDPGGLLPGAKPTPIPGLGPVLIELIGYGLYMLVLAGGSATGYGIYKLAWADKGRQGNGAEPFKWIGAGILAVLMAGILIPMINGIAA
ncbi:hypothetical protein [Streptomyces sp. NPDC093225]|uniref:hypothetical protein n=1 Tax=Streptomyces sp. NPDC093225 TaxID=3366034 RepID=UPI0038228D4C